MSPLRQHLIATGQLKPTSVSRPSAKADPKAMQARQHRDQVGPVGRAIAILERAARRPQ